MALTQLFVLLLKNEFQVFSVEKPFETMVKEAEELVDFVELRVAEKTVPVVDEQKPLHHMQIHELLNAVADLPQKLLTRANELLFLFLELVSEPLVAENLVQF